MKYKSTSSIWTPVKNKNETQDQKSVDGNVDESNVDSVKAHIENTIETPPLLTVKHHLPAIQTPEKLPINGNNSLRLSDKQNSILKTTSPQRLRRHRDLDLECLNLRVPILEGEEFEISNEVISSGGQALIRKRIFRKTSVAIKCFPKTRESYLAFREMLLVDRIRHPNIISIMGVSEGITQYSLIMEYYDSYSLQDVLFSPDTKKIYNLNQSQKNFIAYQLCLALNFLHLDKEPIVHRDVKPGNILVEWAGQKKIRYNIKLCDLGMSKCQKILKDLNTSKGNLKIRGTQYYNAPEVINKQEPLTQSDVWSTACTLVELYSGRSAWNFEETDIVRDEVKEAIFKGESPKFIDTPQFLHTIFKKAFDHDPQKRCSIQDILEVIENQVEFF